MNNKDFSKLQNELDNKGINTYIHHVGEKTYNVIINYEIKRTYKQRRSCKRYIIKLNKN